MKHISSRDNPLVKHARALAHSSRERKKSGIALIEGAHLVTALHARGLMPQTLIASETGMERDEIRKLMEGPAASHVVLSDALFRELSTMETPAGIVALMQPIEARPVAPDAAFCLVLEDIQDPGNVGALLRSAAATGVRDVLMSRTCAFAWAPKVLRAGQGAHFQLNIVEGVDLPAWVRAYRGVSLALTPVGSESLFTTAIEGPVAVLVGNEGAGLSPALLGAATCRVRLPMPGGFESLNAAAAGAIALFEVVRRRHPD